MSFLIRFFVLSFCGLCLAKGSIVKNVVRRSAKVGISRTILRDTNSSSIENLPANALSSKEDKFDTEKSEHSDELTPAFGNELSGEDGEIMAEKREKQTYGMASDGEMNVLPDTIITHDDIDDDVSRNSSNCWLEPNTYNFLNTYDKFEDTFRDVTKHFKVTPEGLDTEILDTFLKYGGIADRTIQEVGGNFGLIRHGLILKGDLIMRLEKSLLFFQYLKLRDDTKFKLNYLKTSLVPLESNIELDLSNLVLYGSYERVITDPSDPSVLSYGDNNGNIEFIMRGVNYSAEIMYRTVLDTIQVDHILSKITPQSVEMVEIRSNGLRLQPTLLEKQNIDSLLSQVEIDLNKWLRDYVDFVMAETISVSKLVTKTTPQHISQFQKYLGERSLMLNEFMDNAVSHFRYRVEQKGYNRLRLPAFTIESAFGPKISLSEGYVEDFSSIYRKSGTGFRNNKILPILTTEIGFGKLKVQYKYKAVLPHILPYALEGTILINADKLTAQLNIYIERDSNAIDLKIWGVKSKGITTMTVEGLLNRYITSLQHILDHHIRSFIRNAVFHSVDVLPQIYSCISDLPAFNDNKETLFSTFAIKRAR